MLAPYRKQAGNKIGMGEEDSPEGRGRELLLTIHSELALVLKTTALPTQGHLPSALPQLPFAVTGCAAGKKARELDEGR